MKHIPNMITGFRLIGAFILCFMEPLSTPFFVLYTLCGVSDVLDGLLARGFHVTSVRGAWLDSIADLIFYFVMIVKNLPILLDICPAYVWYVVGVILLVRLVSYLTVAIKYHRFAAIHTYANKVCGVAVFIIPYMVELDFRNLYFCIALLIALFAAVEELCLHLLGKQYDANVKSILTLRKKMKSEKRTVSNS